MRGVLRSQTMIVRGIRRATPELKLDAMTMMMTMTMMMMMVMTVTMAMMMMVAATTTMVLVSRPLSSQTHVYRGLTLPQDDRVHLLSSCSPSHTWLASLVASQWYCGLSHWWRRSGTVACLTGGCPSKSKCHRDPTQTPCACSRWRTLRPP